MCCQVVRFSNSSIVEMGCVTLQSRVYVSVVEMRCALLQYGVFLFFAGCVILATLFVIICLPETKGVPVENVEQAWHG